MAIVAMAIVAISDFGNKLLQSIKQPAENKKNLSNKATHVLYYRVVSRSCTRYLLGLPKVLLTGN